MIYIISGKRTGDDFIKLDIMLKTIDEVKKFCNYAIDSNNEMYVKQGRYIVDAKSIMGIFSLDLLQELELNIDEPNDDFYDFFLKIKELGVLVIDKNN